MSSLESLVRVHQWILDEKRQRLLGLQQLLERMTGDLEAAVSAARRAFWLSMSPTPRAVPKNRQDFFEQLNQWNADPRKLGEFWKSMSIRDIDYHGNWAIVKFSLKGHSVRVRGSFKRDVTQMFFRIGERWFVFDEKTDDAWLRPPED